MRAYYWKILLWERVIQQRFFRREPGKKRKVQLLVSMTELMIDGTSGGTMWPAFFPLFFAFSTHCPSVSSLFPAG